MDIKKVAENFNNKIIEVLMNRDGMTREEAISKFTRVRNEHNWMYDNPEEVLANEFGLEPDYIWDLVLQARVLG